MLINRDFARLWCGQAISLIGDYVFDTTILLWVATGLLRGRSYAPLVSSGILLVVAVSATVAAPLAGVLVDRWDKHRTMLGADLIRFVLIGALAVLASLPSAVVPLPVTIVLISVVVVLSTAVASFFNPARVVFVGDLVPSEHLNRAAGYTQATAATAAIIGPPLAAPLVIGWGVQWALALNAVSFLISYAFIRSVRPTATVAATPSAADGSDRTGVWREFVVGLSCFRDNRVLMTLLVTSSLVMLGAGAVNALDVYFVQENLHASPGWFGVIGGAFGVGSLVGSTIAGLVGDRLGPSRVFRIGLLVAAVFFLVYSRMVDVWPALVIVTIFSIGLGALGTVTTPLIMNAVPRDLLGRVFSVFGPASQVATVISISVAGALVGALPLGFRTRLLGIDFGRIDVIFAGSSVLILAGAVYALFVLRGSNARPNAAAEATPGTTSSAPRR